MRLLQRYSLRLERQRLRLRARRARRALAPVADRTATIAEGDHLLATVFRNERARLPHFLDYYRRLGIRHVIAIDNGSDDGSGDWLAEQPDCSVWRTEAGYKRARFGMDWINGLLARHACGHWVVTADPDEFLVYPHMDTRPLPALTGWLDASRLRSMGTLLIDLYPEGPLAGAACAEGEDPFATLTHFDGGSYFASRNPRYGNLWVQGGPRMRCLFADDPAAAPALNKIPLVRWERETVYVSSTHSLLPRGLNRTYQRDGGERICGALLHAKLGAGFAAKVDEELARRQHYAASREYRAYAEAGEVTFHTPLSERYQGWRQLDRLGLISAGGWA